LPFFAPSTNLLADITVTRDVAQRGAFELWVCAAYIGNYTNTFRIYASFIKQTSEATVLQKIQYPLQLFGFFRRAPFSGTS
jgi:hypothetical protein